MNRQGIYGSYMYGQTRFGDSVDGSNLPEDINIPFLMKYLPPYYQKSELTMQIQEGFGLETGALNYYKDDLLKQFFISTATWGLNAYEKELGLPTNPSLTYEERREIITAKLRGRGTTTKKMIQNTAESFSGGEVEVIEHFDDYSFTIKFVGVLGIPKNMKSFVKMLEEIKPAHLNYDFKYQYTTCDMLIGWDTKCETLINEKITCKELKTYSPDGGVADET